MKDASETQLPDLKMTPFGPAHVTRNGTEHQTRFLLCSDGETNSFMYWSWLPDYENNW